MVLKQFRELFRVSQQHFQRVESKCGMSGSQLWTLSELDKRPGQTVSELAEALSVHVSTASNLAVRLEREGLLQRRRNAADLRSVRLHLTPRGTRVLDRAPKPVEGVIPDALARMPQRALASLERDLQAVLELARLRDPKAGMKPLSD